MLNTINRKYKAEVWDIMQFLFAKFNDHQIHCVIRLNGKLDENRLRCAADRLIDAFPLIRSRFVEDEGTPYWKDAGFSAKDIVFLRETAHPEEELQKVVCSKTDAARGPQLLLYIIRSKTADLLCVIINHMLCDGVGFKELLYLLSHTYSQLRTNPDYMLPRQNENRSERQILHSFHAKSKVKILAQRYGLSRHDDRVVFGLEGNRNTPFIVTHTIQRERFLAAKAFAKRYGATVNDLLLAAYLRALHSVLPNQTAAIQCVLDLRKFLPCKKSAGLCNLTSNLVCDIGPDVGSSFGDTLLLVKRAMDKEKMQASCLHLIMLLEAVFHVLPYPLAKRAVLREYRNPPLAMSNIGVIDSKRLSFDGIPVASAYITGSVKYSPLFQLALSTFQDEVTLSVAFHGTRADQEKIGHFLELIDTELPCKDFPVRVQGISNRGKGLVVTSGMEIP